MTDCRNKRYHDILTSKSFFYVFVLLGCMMQFLVYEEGRMLSLISGLLGTISLVLVSRRHMSQFFFGFSQLATYLVISWHERLWGEVAITIFYIITMIGALLSWSRNCEGRVVRARILEMKTNLLIGTGVAIAVIGIWQLLTHTNDSQPFMDSFTTVPALAAQILMMLRYREQWIYWIVIDLGSIVMWSIAGDFNMVAQYVFWTLNCIYGWILWKE